LVMSLPLAVIPSHATPLTARRLAGFGQFSGRSTEVAENR
jgi:hypothetical protein